MITFRQPFQDDWPITQDYGEKITSTFHTGIDYGCPTGTRILASADGVVKFANDDKTGYGKCVIIQHDDKRSTLYAHLSVIIVYAGENVKQGQCIGLSGNTGNSTGPHLHFESRKIWNDFRSHFDPYTLPLTTIDDSVVQKPSKSEEEKIFGADKLKCGKVQIVCSDGAFGHNENFTDKKLFNTGQKFTFTGLIKEKDGLQFCKCIPISEPVWIAVNNNETQILKNI